MAMRKWLLKKLFNLDENSPVEHRWKYAATIEMFHPVLRASLDEDLNIIEGSPFIQAIQEPVAGCFVFPLYSQEYCKFLMDQGDENGGWGLKTGDPYTAFEIDLFKLNGSIHKYHKDIVCMKVINNVLSGLFDGYMASKVQNSFLIKYTLDTCLKMDSHHDEKSLVSLSINLNNEFEGGGLEFVRAPNNIVCPEAGYAAMFAGNPFATHRATPITSGNRYVEVFWLR